MYVCCECGSLLRVDRDLDEETKYRRIISEHERYFCSRTLSNDETSFKPAYSISKN